jgi:cytochrome b involved in lipid metabolism
MKKQILIAFALLPALGAGFASSSMTAVQSQPTAATIPAAETENATANRAYTLDDVTKHASASDCWMVIDGKVYDVTKALDNHPGGPAILKGCGTDATQMFYGVKKHGGKARDMLQDYQIGLLK